MAQIPHLRTQQVRFKSKLIPYLVRITENIIKEWSFSSNLFVLTAENAIYTVEIAGNIVQNTNFTSLAHFYKSEGEISFVNFENETFDTVGFNKIYNIYGGITTYFKNSTFTNMTTLPFNPLKTIYEGDLSLLRVNQSILLNIDGITVKESNFTFSNLINLYEINITQIVSLRLETIVV